MTLTCFKSYDVRGRLGAELNPDIARAIGRAFAQVMTPATVVVGYDARETSPTLKQALAEGLTQGGVDVIDIGLCGTEEVYFATAHLEAGGGIMVTASHNPIDYNGMKLVGPGSRPVDPATELAQIRDLAGTGDFAQAEALGTVTSQNTRTAYAAHVASMVRAKALCGVHVLANPGNGTAGAAFDAICSVLQDGGAELTVSKLHFEPDARFPNGIPNPLLPENRGMTAAALKEVGADIGLAWDGDFDRCFFFDETGAFLDGEYVVALLAQAVLVSEPGAHIVHDPRVIWATTDAVAAHGGKAVAAKTGHAFMKAVMRQNDAAYGGEMSAHHYFRDFFFCDSGMIPWLKLVERCVVTGQPLSAMVADLRARFPSSGEINFIVADPTTVVERAVGHWEAEAQSVDRLDGASFDFGDWRMNLRASNTEPLLRLNLEAKGDAVDLDAQVAQVRHVITEVLA